MAMTGPHYRQPYVFCLRFGFTYLYNVFRNKLVVDTICRNILFSDAAFFNLKEKEVGPICSGSYLFRQHFAKFDQLANGGL